MIIKELKGGSLSKTTVVKKDGILVVRKFIFQDCNREYGLVRWHSQIRKLQLLRCYLPEHTPPILGMGIDKNYFYYDIPYYENSDDLSKEVLCIENNTAIISQVISIITKMSSINFGTVTGSFSVFLQEESLSKLKSALNFISLNNEYRNFSNLNDIQNAIDKLKDKIEKYKTISIEEQLTHGNLTLENMIWCKKTNKVILIDPYAETYCESILGDISQILQSTTSGYEYISKNNLYENFNFYKDSSTSIPLSLRKFQKDLFLELNDIVKMDEEMLNLYHSAQFIRMFPFKIEHNPIAALFFLNHGVELLNNA